MGGRLIGVGTMARTWTPDSWRAMPIEQAPEYPDPAALETVEKQLASYPPLVFAGEARKLKAALARVAAGEAFLLQGGDCAESFAEHGADIIRDLFRLFLQMAVVMTYAGAMPVVKVGRIAGQFAKPRTVPPETIGDVSLPAYRGDIVNGIEFDEASRRPDPARMEMAYRQSAATLNLLRAFAQGGYANLEHVHQWMLGFVKDIAAEPPLSGSGRPDLRGDRLHERLRYQRENDAGAADDRFLHQPRSAPARLRGGADARRFDQRGVVRHVRPYAVDRRPHAPAGQRASRILSRHPEPARPQMRPGIGPDELIRLIDMLNPNNEPGRLTLIGRFGADKVEAHLPRLIRAVEREGRIVAWASDPMHGNTVKVNGGYKTRPFDRILREVEQFFAVHRAEGTHPGGIHIEMTGSNVTECIGGARSISEADLSSRYHTHCDPRLNSDQALELAFLVSELLRRGRQPNGQRIAVGV